MFGRIPGSHSKLFRHTGRDLQFVMKSRGASGTLCLLLSVVSSLRLHLLGHCDVARTTVGFEWRSPLYDDRSVSWITQCELKQNLKKFKLLGQFR